ncbi:DUF5985 family protein [Verrucomicrobiota bacterium sgz303538]
MLTTFLYGALCVACAVASMLFMRLWQRSRDRLFGFFAAAFATLAIERILLTAVNPEYEYAPYVYVARLIAFGLIIVAIVDKNRQG